MELSEQLASFEQSIETFQTAVGDPATADTPLDTQQISQQSALLPAQFQKIIATLSETQLHPTLDPALHPTLDPTVEQQIGTYQTEAHRRLRLIGIEAMRLRTAKQPASILRSRQQLCTHITQLQQFVQAMHTAINPQP